MNANSAGSLHSKLKPAETRFDKYGVQQIGREYRLKPNQRLVLFMMANVVHYTTGDWTGTLLELHDDTGISRDTLATVVADLVDVGLLLQLEPFTRNGQGCYRLLCLERLIVLSEDVAQNLRDRFATDLSAIRGGYVGSSTYDQPKEGSVRNKAIRNKATGKSEQDEDLSDDHAPAQGDEDQCGYPGCTELYNDDHTFTDHEPVPPTTLSKTTELFDAQNPGRGLGSLDIAFAATVAENGEDGGAHSFGTKESPPEPCLICGAPPPRRGSFGWFRCDHQIVALDEEATS